MAVIPIPDNLRIIVLAKLQIAPLRTFAASDRGFLLPVGPQTREAAGSLTASESSADGRCCTAIR